MEQNDSITTNETINSRARSKSVLVNQEESRLFRKIKTMHIGEQKTVVFDLENTTEQKPITNIPEVPIKKQTEKEKKKKVDSTRKTSCCLPKGPVTIEGCVIEIIDSKGNISKTIIKKGKDEPKQNEFTKTVIRKHSGEYLKAQMFFNENKEKEEVDDFINEDTKTNTMRNQFVGKMEVLDNGSARSRLKKKTNEA